MTHEFSTDDPRVVWHAHAINRGERERLNGHRSCVVWFTGLSGSGKSTIANIVDQSLYHMGVRSYLLDGDNVRHGLNATPQMLAPQHGEEFARRFGLGFGAQDREENIRRIGAVSKLFCEAGVLTLTAFVSPYRADRDRVRETLDEGDFIEVFVDTPLEVCEARDPKGMYREARAGKLKGFTGVDDPYQPPVAPELTLNGGGGSADELADEVIAHLRKVGKLS